MHLPDTAPRPLEPKPSVDLDMVLDDAEGREDYSVVLSADPSAWRSALGDLLDEVRSEITALNEERNALQQNRSHGRRREISEERSALVVRQSLLETRLRYVKGITGKFTRPKHDPSQGTPLEQARAHLFAAIDLLNEIKDEAAKD